MHKSKYSMHRYTGAPCTMRGVVAVEFALLIIPMMILAFGVADYGRAIYQYNTLVKSVRDAARHLSQYNPTDVISYPQARNEAICLAMHGNKTCNGPTLVPGLTSSMIEVNPVTATAAGKTITLVEVRISDYVFDFMFNPANLFGNGADTLPFGDIRATMRQL